MLSASILLITIIRPRPALPGLGEHPAGVDFDARLGVDHDRRRIHAAQGPDRLADEVGIARRVDHVELLAGVVEMDDVASIVYLCCFSSSSKSQMLVPSSTLAGRLTAPVRSAGLVDQRGLAGRAVAAEGDVADVCDWVLRHVSFLLSAFRRNAV